MFEKLGRFVSRTWLGWLVFWAAAWGASYLVAPSWNEVASVSELQHLPDEMPTRVGSRLHERAFPGSLAKSNIVVVLSRPGQELEFDDFQFMAGHLTPALDGVARRRGGVLIPSTRTHLASVWAGFERLASGSAGGRETGGRDTGSGGSGEVENASVISTPRSAVVSEDARIVSILAPHNSVAGPLLVSQDRQAMLVVVHLTHAFLSSENQTLIEEVERAVERLDEDGEVPRGLKIDLTGSAIVGRDVYTAVAASTTAIQRWTVWIVLALLLLVFRAPLPALIPLATLFCAVTISLNLMAGLAGGGYLDVYDGLKVYATVLIYGAGVDYSLFLISRHAEALSRGESAKAATVQATAKVGAVVVISAATEILAINMLSWTRFGKFAEAGQAIPLGLAVTLAASLTLTFALLCLVGRRGFWPLKMRKAGRGEPADASIYKRWPERGVTGQFWERIGKRLQRRPLTWWTATVLLLAPLCIVAVWNSGNMTYDMVSGLPAGSPSVAGNRVLKKHFPAGVTGPVTVLLRNDRMDFGSEEGIRLLEQWGRTFRQDNPGMKLADLRSVADPLGRSERFVQRVDFLKGVIPKLLQVLPEDDPLIAANVTDPPQVEAVEAALASVAATHYVSQQAGYAGHVAQITLVFHDEPFSRSSIERIGRLQTAIPAALPAPWKENMVVFMTGPTASLFDIKTIADEDRVRLYFLVTTAVFLVLWILLRDLVLSIFLVASVIFTYLVTMGVTFLTFYWLQGNEFVGLEWSVPLLLFTLLMAVGADYNVFLVQRCREEEQRRDPREAITAALGATGGLISGAGVVMAGTFSALLWGGTLVGMHQLGFALCLGVLVDTFLVRPILVPAFLIIRLDRWRAVRNLFAADRQDPSSSPK